MMITKKLALIWRISLLFCIFSLFCIVSDRGRLVIGLILSLIGIISIAESR